LEEHSHQFKFESHKEKEMADFRKLLFVLIAGALLFTTVASADPYGCSITPTQTLVRQEGLADYVGDIVLDCHGDVPNPAVGIKDVNIRMTIDTPGVNITSNLLETTNVVTEATMVMNEGLTSTGRRYIGYVTAPPVAVPQSDGSQNVYQAVKVADNAVEWQGVVVAGPGSNPFHLIRLTNVRVNAASLPVGAAIIARVNITSPTSFPILNTASVTVANVIKAMTFSVVASSFDQCVLPPRGETVGHFHLKYAEGYGPAFKIQGDADVDNIIPGGNYPNESGFGVPSVTGALVNRAAIGQADNPTQLKATIKHIPLGVDHLDTDDPIITGGGDITLSVVVSAITGSTADADGRVATITASVIAVSDVAQYLPNVVDIPVELRLDYTVPAIRGTVTAQGTLAPTSIVGTMNRVAPEPRFVDTGSPVDAFVFSGVCHTLLLFPYLTNQAGFDTGFVISNTSVDPLGTAPQEGTCTLNYYGFTGNHAALTAAQSVATSPNVPAGAQLVLLLSAGGGAVNPMGAGAAVSCPNCAPIAFQGYMIASCNFQFAHGYAFVSDAGATKLAQGYLAMVIPERFYQDRDRDRDNEPPRSLRQPQFAGLDAQGNQGEQLGN